MFFVEPAVKSSVVSMGGISYYINKCYVMKHVVDDNIICLSATQLMHEPAHGARNTVQQLLGKTLNFISSKLNQLITRFRESTAA